MITVPEGIIPPLLRATRANRIFTSEVQARRHIRQRALRPHSYGPPSRLGSGVHVDVGERHGRPVYTVTPTAKEPRGAIVYVHGGAWVNEIVSQHWRLAAQLASECGARVILPIYGLVPFGTADDALQLVKELILDSLDRYGATCLAGDSAGGQIALSTVQVLRGEHGMTLPRTTLISPALDLTWSNPEIPVVQPTDPWLATPGGRVFAEHWRGERDLLHPVVSPLAGSMAGLGPLSIFTGTRDVLNPDARLLRDEAHKAGVDVTFHEGVGQVHVYPLLPTARARSMRQLLATELREALEA